MRINSINVKNKFVSLSNVSLDFSDLGVICIKGENGTGKSSLLKEIIFGNYDVSFLSEHQAEVYKTNRSALFSYLPQEIPPCNLTIRQYITKENTMINDGDIKKYLEKFNLDEEDLSKTVNKLSGGELIKCAIISVLLKDTPYIFFDEPTNNMDDGSVEVFAKEIKELAKRKTIVIISHDERLELSPIREYYIKQNEIETNNYRKQNIKNEIKTTKSKPKYLKLVRLIGKSKLRILFVAYFAAILIFTLIYNDYQYKKNYSEDEYIGEKGTICSYEADFGYGELNKTYCEKAGINILQDRYERLMMYSDIPEIANLDGVRDIIMYDVEYVYNLYEKSINNTLLEQIEILTLPEKVTSGLVDFYTLGFDISFIKKGHYPEDNKSQVVVSEDILRNYYGYSETDIQDAIGKKILIKGNEYEIVGIHYYDICFISYSSKNSNYGFYKYNAESYEEFSQRMIKYKLEIIDTFAYNYADTVIIECDENYEKNVLNYLIKNYPATNFYSYEFVYSWVDEHNQVLNQKMYIWNILCALIFGISMATIYHFACINVQGKLEIYMAYYISKRKLRYIYALSRMMLYIIPFLIGLFFIYTQTTYKGMLIKFYVLMYFVICIPTIIRYIAQGIDKRWH